MKKSKIIINNDIELINYLKEICDLRFCSVLKKISQRGWFYYLAIITKAIILSVFRGDILLHKNSTTL